MWKNLKLYSAVTEDMVQSSHHVEVQQDDMAAVLQACLLLEA